MSLSAAHFLAQPRPIDPGALPTGHADTSTVAAHDFDVDVRTGFMPPDEPLVRLPDQWRMWELALDQAPVIPLALADNGPPTDQRAHALSEQWRQSIREMPMLDIDGLVVSERLLRRAHLVLAFLLHFYVHSRPETSVVITPSLGIPLLRVSAVLQIPPLLTYSDTVLYNWRKIDPSDPVSERNIQIATTLSGSHDEAHFYLTSALIELRGTLALNLMRVSLSEAFVGDATAVRRLIVYLRRLADVIAQLTDILRDVRTACDPATFYDAIRPWLRGQDSTADPIRGAWVFAEAESYGCDHPKEMSGPSAGQSSLIYAIDIFLGIDHHTHSAVPSGHGKPFLERMKQYMPRHHRAFLNHLASEPRSVRNLVQSAQDPKLTDAFNLAVQRLKELRDQHIQVVALYIITQARRYHIVPKGTGGTDTIPFLKKVRDATALSSLSDAISIDHSHSDTLSWEESNL